MINLPTGNNLDILFIIFWTALLIMLMFGLSFTTTLSDKTSRVFASFVLMVAFLIVAVPFSVVFFMSVSH